MTPQSRHLSPGLAAQQGRTLIEVMVAVLLGSVVLVAVLLSTSTGSITNQRVDNAGRMSETAQIAASILAKDLRMAGYSEPVLAHAVGYYTRPYQDAAVFGCDAGFRNASGGGAAQTMANLLCNASSGDVNRDSAAISVIYQADAFNSVWVNNGSMPAPSDCRGDGLDEITPGVPGNAVSTNPRLRTEVGPFWLVENRYFIATSNGEPTLMCAGNGGSVGGTLFSNSTPLVRGVERMVILYGMADGAPNPNNPGLLDGQVDVGSYMTASEIATHAPWATDLNDRVRWQRATAVRICLEVRGEANSADASLGAPSFVNCNGNVVNITDKRQRRVLYLTVGLRNRGTMPGNGGTGPIGFGGV